jgi:hypothetical protein
MGGIESTIDLVAVTNSVKKLEAMEKAALLDAPTDEAFGRPIRVVLDTCGLAIAPLVVSQARKNEHVRDNGTTNAEALKRGDFI